MTRPPWPEYETHIVNTDARHNIIDAAQKRLRDLEGQ